MNTLLLVLLVLFVSGLVLLLILYPFIAPRLLKPGVGQGSYVAEVWLEWSLGRGSTMYRQRFTTQKQAHDYMRVYAWVLDSLLPRYFMSTDWSGRRIRVSNDMSIKYGVREITEEESKDFRVIWSTSMPGQAGYAGEHVDAHPWLNRGPKASALETNLKV